MTTLAGLAVLSLPGILFALRRLPLPSRRAPAPPHHPVARSAVMATEFRNCPAEELTRAVIVRADGSGLCDCGAIIPALPLTPPGETL